jgi:hypothetical protein
MSGHGPAIARRDAIALLTAIAAAACSGPRPAPAVAPPAPEPFTVDPLVDLVPAAGLRWLIALRPRALYSDEVLAAQLGLVIPDEQFAAFALRHGGVDPRSATELVAAGFDGASLALAALAVNPPEIESAFTRRALAVEGRAVEHGITRLWGSVGDAREQVAVFGRSAVGIEQGRFGPLGVATYFATGRLHRARPALRSEPLEATARRLGDAPVRAFAPGPFEGAWAKGLGGLLRASTAAGVALQPLVMRAAMHGEGRHAVGSALALKMVLMGAWSNDGAAAADRLGAAYQVLAGDALGRLINLSDATLVGPKVSWDDSALELEVTFEAAKLARGLHVVTSGSLEEIMAL